MIVIFITVVSLQIKYMKGHIWPSSSEVGVLFEPMIFLKSNFFHVTRVSEWLNVIIANHITSLFTKWIEIWGCRKRSCSPHSFEVRVWWNSNNWLFSEYYTWYKIHTWYMLEISFPFLFRKKKSLKIACSYDFFGIFHRTFRILPNIQGRAYIMTSFKDGRCLF